MIFDTLYSSYELDPEQRRIRRLSGQNDPTPRQGPDGQWKTFHDIENVEVGLNALIVWQVDDTDTGPVLRSTETSQITAIRDRTTGGAA